MKHHLQVIKVEEVSGTSKNGPYKFNKLHCIISGETQNDDPIVGVLVPPKDLNNVGKGFYEAEFGLSVDREQRVVGVLKSLTPVARAASVKTA